MKCRDFNVLDLIVLQANQEHGVIGYRVEVQGLLQLDLIATGVIKGGTPGITIGVLRRGC